MSGSRPTAADLPSTATDAPSIHVHVGYADAGAARSFAESPAVCVFLSSSMTIAPRYLELAAQVGSTLARHGWRVVSGGGGISMMGALVQSARAGGAHTTGVIPQSLLALEVADTHADQLIVTEDMRERKGLMDQHSDAFLILPGGIGTLEEFFEVWVGAVLGMHHKPVVVCDPWQDFAELHHFLDSLTQKGFVRSDAIAHVHWTNSVAAAIAAIRLGWQQPLPEVSTSTHTEVELEGD